MAKPPSLPVTTKDNTPKILAIWRILLFLMMTFQFYNNLPHLPTSHTETQNSAALDRMFTLDQFEWILTTMPTTEGAVSFNKNLGFLLGLSATAGFCYPLSSLMFSLLYARQFFYSAANFTDHDYLFILLMLITSFSGADSFLSVDSNFKRLGMDPKTKKAQAESPPASLPSSVAHRAYSIVVLRCQIAVIYFFAALWKLHPDWLDGHIVRTIFLSFEEQGVARGVAWAARDKLYGLAFWRFIALAGLLLDLGMFLLMFFTRPRPSTTFTFASLKLMFHGFTMFTMSQRIGYAFPAVCMASLVLFFPVATTTASDDGDLAVWQWLGCFLGIGKIGNGPARRQARAIAWTSKFVVILYVLVQIGLPLRMPVISKGNFPLTGVGYRFSWTMMLHGTSSQMSFQHPAMKRKEKFGMNLFGLLPTTSIDNIPRRLYMPGSSKIFEDDRTLPLSATLSPRHSALMGVFLRTLSRVGGNFARLISYQAPPGMDIKVHAIYFAQLNGHGPFVRVVDPSVDLVKTNSYLRGRGTLEKIMGVIFDWMPAEFEFILGEGSRIVSTTEADAIVTTLQATYKSKHVHLVADRGACLGVQPIWLQTMGATAKVLLLKAPEGGGIMTRCCARILEESEEFAGNKFNEGQCTEKVLSLGGDADEIWMGSCWRLEVELTGVVGGGWGSLGEEIGEKEGEGKGEESCSESSEDLLFAIIA